MFTTGASNGQRQRSQSQSLSPSVPYRQQEYYPMITPPSRPHMQSPGNTYHPTAGSYANVRDADDYQQTTEHYVDTRHSPGAIYLKETGFAQSYDRHSMGSVYPDTSVDHSQEYSGVPRSEGTNWDTLNEHDNSDIVHNFASAKDQSFSENSLSTVTGAPNLESGEVDPWTNQRPASPSPAPPKLKKPRREKPHIALAPDQPPTTQGKPRARVYVACLQCRSRKIRCDGAKPVCHNCGRRANGHECNYDSIPKRRGPDKTPGARQRAARELAGMLDNGPTPRRRRRATITSTSESYPSENNQTPALINQVRESNVPLDGSPDTFTGIYVANPEYSPPPYSSCSCHGVSHCPTLLGIEGIVSSRKHVSIVTTYDGVLDSVPLYASRTTRGYITELDEEGNEVEKSLSDISNEPSVEFSRKTWWDALLTSYLYPSSSSRHSLTLSQRETASHQITSDLRFIFKASNYWFSFFHIPTFFGNFFDPVRRQKIQPSLVLSLLSLATFWQSSEVGYGKEGRERALRLRDEAQSAMDASFNAGWIDETLAQSAWLLALFEICAHPRHSTYRATSSMIMLDSIIRSMSLTSVDADDPNASFFSPGTVPAVDSPKASQSWISPTLPASNSSSGQHQYNFSPLQPIAEIGCSCNSLTLEERWPQAAEYAPLWDRTPAWDESWTESEIRKESCRRLCWSSMILAAGHISYTTSRRAGDLHYDLFISDPANYAILFSGEMVARSPALSSQSSKNTIWALHDRCFLLWHACMRMRANTEVSDTDKAQFAMKAWLEADSLELALNRHTCSIEKAFIFQAREYIFNTRMCISYEFQRYIPLVSANVNGMFHRGKAEEWLTHQATVAERYMFGLHTITGNASNLLARRPFFVFWFMGQIHRSLALWECDRSLTVALDVCKALIPAIDYLTALWPCPEQRYRYESLREKVAASCHLAGVIGPPPLDLSLNIARSSETFV